MKAEPYKYYKTTQHGMLKYIKTNNINSQVVGYVNGKPQIFNFPDPYPMWTDSEAPECTREEFETQLAQAEKLSV